MKKAASILLAGAILVSGGAVVTASESLVSKSYVDGTFTTQALEQVSKRAEEEMSASYNQALNELNSKHSSYLSQVGGSTGGTSVSSGLSDRRLKKGDVLTLSSGSGVMLLAGSASASGGVLVDTTAGTTVAAGGGLTARHRCLAGETAAAVTITSDTAVLSLEGSYTLSASGNVDYNAMADGLAQMGLLKGTGAAYGSGYELERQALRVEGLVMFIRLMGEENAALTSTAVNPFADSPSWADRYLAYAYEKGYTTGIGTNAAGQLMFGPNNTISAGEYMTFVLRALGYSESGTNPDFNWQNAMDAAVAYGVIRQSEAALLSGSSFCRAQVVYLSVCALSAPTKTGGILLDKTASNGGYDQTSMQAILNGISALRLS
ncbi:hypothetical protein B5G34_02355 [Flavonifractor sp. An82]|uniref:S-layer homology domain-containing protein n=1 Tax=Flavonifractor sp. An82 TaxID=1965660 RepID=UPI000B398476|nr:S-layer homology domain-containing protein [Flavonifractor sp. An82]OUN23945.1 hypothetical protein B5G34_02355 [Flavonifractor sp. An82]